MTWQLQEAKNKLSEVVETTLSDGPQIISRRGKNTVVLMSYDEYKRLTKKKTIKEVLMSSDLSSLDLQRDKSTEGRATPIDFDNLLNSTPRSTPTTKL